MIEHVCARAGDARLVDAVVVATDDRHVTAVSLDDSHTLWQAVRSTTLPAAPALAPSGELVVVAGRGGFATAVTASLAREYVTVRDLRIDKHTLDDAFIALTGRSLQV